ncbi:hypothetical protein ACO0LB_20305 [Undibacterium sp. SXout7W]|uniref:hypothetical protein n=1 Tax=Undibacterium sp. SXout7W TaxID=3413049 RepID=UPI003BF2C545
MTEQSGLKAGDSGFQITVAGNTSLTGAIITSTDNAAQQNKNTFQSSQLTTSDLQNNASYQAQSYAVSISSNGAGAGVGNASGNSTSVTPSGISGIAGNKDARTGDKETGIQQIFDPNAVNKDITAQAQITSEFGKLAPKFIAGYADNKAITLNTLAASESDPQKKAELEAEAEKWSEGGIYRIVLHSTTGAATGGISGAAGAATSASAAEWISNLQSGIQTNLQKAGLSEEIANLTAKGIADLTAAGIGLLAGGTQGAATALATDANNRQLHPNDYTLAKALAAKSKGQYTEQQILDALRASGVKDSNGNVIVAEDTREILINKNGTLTNINNGLTIQETYKEDKSIILRPSGQTALIEDAPVRPNNDLITFIIANTGGTASPFILTKGPTYTTTSSLVAAPDGTQRATVTVDGNAYFPLIANCPAANCTNGNPIANAIPDAGTQAYNEALAKKQEKDLNIATTVLGLGSTILRAVQVVDEIATAGMTANNVGKVGGGGNIITSEGTAGAVSGLNLSKSLTSEQRLSELTSGGGSVMAGNGSNVVLRDAARLVAEYGGSISDWSKVSSTSATAADGTVFEIHAYRNVITGQVVEPKTIQPIKLPGK